MRPGVLMQRIDPDIFQVADEFLSNPIADKPTILVVDDQEIIADTTAEILNRFGFRAVRTYDAQTALQIAAKLNPDFLLTDVSMPIMNGGGTRHRHHQALSRNKDPAFFRSGGRLRYCARGRRKRLCIRRL